VFAEPSVRPSRARLAVSGAPGKQQTKT